jgi:hypothetical protein
MLASDLFVLQLFAYGLTLAAALVLVDRGGYAWLSRTASVSGPVTAAAVAGLAAASMESARLSLEGRAAASTPIGLLGAALVPLALQAFLASLAWVRTPSLTWPRAAGAALALVAVLGWGAVAAAVLRHESARMKKLAQEDVAREETRHAEEKAESDRIAAQDTALDALSDDAPLPEFLSHLFIDKTDAHHARAVERMKKLPRLNERLAERLAVPEPIQREYAANFIRMCPAADPAWAPAVRKAILLLAEDYRADAKDRSRGKITHVKGLTHGMLLTAQKFEGERFDAEVKELRTALETWPDAEERRAPLELVDAYLAGKNLINE